MLRLIVAVLIAANLTYLVWSQGWLGMAPASERDPSRLARQVQPQAVTVLSPTAARAVLARPPCLEAGPFADAALAAAEQALAALPPGSWQRVEVDPAGRAVLRIGAADAALRDQLATLDASALGGGFGPCRVR